MPRVEPSSPLPLPFPLQPSNNTAGGDGRNVDVYRIWESMKDPPPFSIKVTFQHSSGAPLPEDDDHGPCSHSFTHPRTHSSQVADGMLMPDFLDRVRSEPRPPRLSMASVPLGLGADLCEAIVRSL